jgi:hypothetical protein
MLMLLGTWNVSIAGEKSASVVFNGASQEEDGVACSYKNMKPRQAFNYSAAVTNTSANDGAVNVTYFGGESVSFPIPAGNSFSFTQSAGSKNDNDNKAVRINFLVDNSQTYDGIVSATTHQAGVECTPCGAFAQGNDETTCDDIFIIDNP